MTARTLIAAAVFVCAGCSQTRHYHEARPVTATLEINVEGQWQTLQRVRYSYEKPMTEWQSLSWQELDVILRDREARGIFDSETEKLRSLIECKKLGMEE